MQQTKFKVVLQHSRVVPPPGIFQTIKVVGKNWSGPDVLFMLVEGDGSDLQKLVETRKDVFSFCEPNPADFEL